MFFPIVMIWNCKHLPLMLVNVTFYNYYKQQIENVYFFVFKKVNLKTNLKIKKMVYV